MWAALNEGLLVQRTFREIMFLQELNNHENIIRSVPTPIFSRTLSHPAASLPDPTVTPSDVIRPMGCRATRTRTSALHL